MKDLTGLRIELQKPSNFSLKASHRTQIIKDRNKVGKDDAQVAAALQSVKSSLDKDMVGFLRTKDGPATRKWLSSNRKFAAEADITKRTSIKQILEKGDIKPELVLTALKSGRPSELKRLHSQLTDKGRETAKKALIQQALKDSKFFELDINANPDALATALNKPAFQMAANVFFKGAAKAELDGLNRLLNATRQAQKGQAAVKTGEIAAAMLPVGGVAALASQFPLTTAGGVALSSAMVKAYESKLFRNLMIKLKNAEPGSTQALKIQEAAMPFILSAVQSTKDNDTEQD